jgi:hypothetical protein
VLGAVVGLNHVAPRPGQMVSFSLGLVTVLIGIGIVLLRSRSLVERVGRRGLGRRFDPALPLGRAALVTLPATSPTQA